MRAPPASAAKGAASKRPPGGVLRLRDIWNVQRLQFSPAAAVGAAIPFLFTNKASAVESKRILTVHSFSGAAPGADCAASLTRMSNAEKKKAGSSGRIALQVFLTGVAYYLATEIAWALCFPNSKVSLLFPPHAVLVVILLLVPVRHWWAYTLATIVAHFVATQQAHWPVLYALQCEAFDAVQNVLAAAGIRLFIKSPLEGITLRDAIVFVLIAVIIVPFGTAFWGAAFTISNHFGTHYWIEWRNLGISNGVTAVVLVPALLLAANRLSGRGGKSAACAHESREACWRWES